MENFSVQEEEEGGECEELEVSAIVKLNGENRFDEEVFNVSLCCVRCIAAKQHAYKVGSGGSHDLKMRSSLNARWDRNLST